MPRAKGVRETPAKLAENRTIWGQFGKTDVGYAITGWDFKPSFVEAILEVLQSGSTVVLRPGSGQRSIGIAIWEGDFRHPPTWCYQPEEVDMWAESIMERVKRQDAAD